MRPALAALLLAACEVGGIRVDPNLERMIDQSRYEAYEASEYFPDGAVSRLPPAGTVPRGRRLGEPMRERGHVGTTYADRVPVPLTRELLDAGRRAYDTSCGVCHGVLGDGDSVVAQNMTLRRPPSLHDPRIRAYPPGRVFRVATEGFGLMPGYERSLTTEERWAVVAYIQALQLSQAFPADRLPADVREKLDAEGSP